jgi:hypothetical protein
MPDWGIVLRDGGLIALIASAYVMTLLRLNPRLFRRNYPSEVRQAVPPVSPEERKIGALAALPLFVVIIGGPLLSAWMLAHDRSEVSGAGLFWHTLAVSMVFNTVDLLVLDWFWLGVLRPRWAEMPGADGVAYRFNWLQHVRGFVVGTVLAAILAIVAMLLWGLA